MLLEEDQKEQMMFDGMAILNSIAFLEKEFSKTYSELEEAKNNHFYEDLEKIQSRIYFLRRQIQDEDKLIADFMLKYKESNEKETLLSGVK